jgi:TRAP-type uncharacterized transport system substrate-binding protein
MGGRRVLLTGALGASAMLLMGHSPYRRWAQYRARHTVIVTDRGDEGAWPLVERLVAHLEARRPDLRPVAARGESAATVLSLLKTRQLDLAVLRAEDAYQGLHGTGPRPDLATALRALAAVAPEYLYVLVAETSPVRALGDLGRARVAVAGPRAEVKARRLLAVSGLDPAADVRWLSLPLESSIAALGRGEVQAVVFESPAASPVRVVGDLRLRPIPLDTAVGALVARYGPIYFAAAPPPSGETAGAAGGDVLAEARLLVSREDYPVERARTIVESLEGSRDLAPRDTPLAIPRHAGTPGPSRRPESR